jgi:hypothetical protein
VPSFMGLQIMRMWTLAMEEGRNKPLRILNVCFKACFTYFTVLKFMLGLFINGKS